MKWDRKILFLAAAVLLPVVLISGFRTVYMPDGHENCEDVYWHIAAGKRPLNEMIRKDFPITLSVWRDRFADKELMFHFCMKAYVQVKKILHSPLLPPFNGALPGLFLFIFIMYVLCAYRAKIPPGMILILSLLTGFLTPVFTYRLLMLRPHLLSIGLMLTAYYILMQGVEKKRTLFLMFLLGMIYAWSYSTPHLVCFAALAFGFAGVREHRAKAFFPFLGTLAGVPAGLLLHPQFPNTFVIWKVQGLDALLAPINGEIPNLPYARELLSPSPEWLLQALPIFILLYLTLLLSIRSLEKHCYFKLESSTRAMIYLSLFWCGAMTVISIRPVEYAVPTITLTLGMLYKEGRKHELFSFCWTRVPEILTIILLLGSLIFTFTVCRSDMLYWTKMNPTGVIEKLRMLAKPGDRVINLDWSDFPELYFNAPEFEYTWGLEPMFSYAFDSKRTALLSDCIMFQKKMRPWQIGTALQADYAVLTDNRKSLGHYLVNTCRWKPVHHDESGWIFRIR